MTIGRICRFHGQLLDHPTRSGRRLRADRWRHERGWAKEPRGYLYSDFLRLFSFWPSIDNILFLFFSLSLALQRPPFLFSLFPPCSPLTALPEQCGIVYDDWQGTKQAAGQPHPSRSVLTRSRYILLLFFGDASFLSDGLFLLVSRLGCARALHRARHTLTEIPNIASS